jgi:uncharacterized FAD-dependent dehydrogenase
MNNIYDCGIIGAGVAGAFAALKIAKDHKNKKAILFDLGRPPQKRRGQTIGWLGCLPNSDGKLYLNDLNAVKEITGARKVNSAFSFFNKAIKDVNKFKIIKDKSPSISLEKKFKKIGYDIQTNDYIQVYPKDIHTLSKIMSDQIEAAGNITFNFDEEIKSIYKQKNVFVITSEHNKEYRCKKIIIAVGRSGWRWAKELYSSFGILDSNDVAKFGIRIEMNSGLLKEFNKSNCNLSKIGEVDIGPFSWNGTVIPEDHVDMAISSFRSNENRWKTDKVSFNLIGHRPFLKSGFEQTDRLGKLTFVLANDRIIKERVSSILNGKSKISIIPEYDWLKDTIKELAAVIPEIATKAYCHMPTIMPMCPKINIGNNLESEIDGMFIVGESASIHGLLAAACTGIISGDTVFK